MVVRQAPPAGLTHTVAAPARAEPSIDRATPAPSRPPSVPTTFLPNVIMARVLDFDQMRDDPVSTPSGERPKAWLSPSPICQTSGRRRSRGASESDAIVARGRHRQVAHWDYP